MTGLERAREIAKKIAEYDHLLVIHTELNQIADFDKRTKELLDTDNFYVNEAINKISTEILSIEKELNNDNT